MLGRYLIARALRERKVGLLPIGVTEVLVGLGSFAFHATNTFFGEVLDVSAMISSLGLCISQSAARLLDWPARRTITVFSVGSLVSCAILVAVRNVGVQLFGLVMVAAFGFEIRSVRQRGWLPAHREMLYLVATFGCASTVWWLDVLQISGVCVPARHWSSGHAATGISSIPSALCFCIASMRTRVKLLFTRKGRVRCR